MDAFGSDDIASPLRFGILILQNDSWATLVERAQRYEALGFDTVWVADCFVDPWEPARPWYEGWTLLAGLAAQTSRIRIGPLVSNIIYRNPALLARQAMTVDHISNGRLDLGMGAGASDYDWTMTSGDDPWPYPERADRLAEAVAIVDRLLREETSSYDGRYYRVTEALMAPRPIQRPRPPLTIAAHGSTTIKLAAQFADTWNTAGTYRELADWSTGHRGTTAADVARVTRRLGDLLDEQALAFGRDPRTIARSVLAGYEWSERVTDPWSSVEAHRDWVGRYQELGFTEFITPEPGPGQDAVLDAVAETVLPELRADALA